MNFLHDEVPFRIVGEYPGTALESFALILGNLQGPYSDFYFFVRREAEVFAQLDRPAVDFAVNYFDHVITLPSRLPQCISPPSTGSVTRTGLLSQFALAHPPILTREAINEWDPCPR